MQGMELICFQIIATSGSARSHYIEAIQLAKQKEYEKAALLLEEADQEFIEAHQIHAHLIQKEANGEINEIKVLLVHAMDQMMTTEIFGILANEFIEIYKAMNNS